MNRIDWVLLSLLIISIADSAYLVLAEASTVPLYCSTTGLIDCKSVLLSKYAYIFGVPLSYYAIFWSVVALALLLVAHRHRHAEGFRDFWLAIGIGGAIYSIASMYALGSFCDYCLALDAILIIIFAITVDKYR